MRFDAASLKRLAGRLAPAVAAFGAVLAVHALGLLQPIDQGLAAWRAQTITRAPSGGVVVVEIDSASLRQEGAWPWPRERYGEAIARLRAAGADIIGFDVDFSAPSTAASDAAFRNAIERADGAVVLPTFNQPGGFNNTPLAAIAGAAAFGGVNIRADADGVVRRYTQGEDTAEGYRPSMAAVLAAAPFGRTGDFLIDFGVNHRAIPRLSFSEVLHGSFDPAVVRGRAVLIGATALELGDEFATPIAPSLSGVYLHALAFESLAQHRTLLALHPWLPLALAFGALALLWPRLGALRLKRHLTQQAALAGLVIAAPFALQAGAPISVDIAIVLFAQLLALLLAVHRELRRRETALLLQREENLLFNATHDSETGLPNRRAMLASIDAAKAQGRGVPVVFAIGLERFEVLRGAIGYAAANRLVEAIAARISDCAGGAYQISSSILGAVIVAPKGHDVMAECAAKLASIAGLVRVDGNDVRVDLRGGAALCAADEGAELLIERAALALDQARLTGRPFVLYDPDNAPDPRIQLALISDVQRGLERGEFTLLYQPKASPRDGRILGAEALMRWRHPEHGPIAPDRFIVVAEETGAVDDLTRWALARAMADQTEMRRAGIDLPLAVNVSGRSLSTPGFCEEVIAMVRAAGARIVVEVTETAIIQEPALAMAAIAALREAGIRVAIDDYGSGLSSLSYLKQIAADELKLDKSLTAELSAGARDRLILRSTIELAHGLGLSVVAEGVEDSLACLTLSAMGCDAVQGYYIAKPLPAAELTALCQARAAELTSAPAVKAL